MSYENIEEVRIKRAAKDATKAKGKRGWKRKSLAPKADELETELQREVAEMIEAPEPWRASVAQII